MKAKERNIRLKKDLAAKNNSCNVLTAQRNVLQNECDRLTTKYNARLRALKRQQEIQATSECASDSATSCNPQNDAELLKLEREIEEKKQVLESLNNQIHLIN